MLIIITAHNYEERILGLAPETQGRTLFINKVRVVNKPAGSRRRREFILWRSALFLILPSSQRPHIKKPSIQVCPQSHKTRIHQKPQELEKEWVHKKAGLTQKSTTYLFEILGELEKKIIDLVLIPQQGRMLTKSIYMILLEIFNFWYSQHFGIQFLHKRRRFYPGSKPPTLVKA